MSNCCGTTPKKEEKNKNCCGTAPAVEVKEKKWKKHWRVAVKDFKNAAPFLLIGVAIGSMIYGFVPTEFIAKYTNKSNPFAVPISAVIGVPLYVRAEAVIPLSAALVKKGMSLGAAMALIIGSAGASLTEVILLKSLFNNKIIIAFLVIVLGMAIASGYTMNALF